MTTLEHLCKEWDVSINVRKYPIRLETIGRNRHLPALFASLGFTRGAEIGVQKGCYSERLCEMNPSLHLLCVDPWITYEGYDGYEKKKTLAFREEAFRRLKDHDCEIVEKLSVDAARSVEDQSLDFVYIDANHSLPHVIADIAAWEPKVRSGGIVAGHDFVKLRWEHKKPRIPYLGTHVVQAVTAWTQANDIRPWFSLRGDRNRQPSWLWVKK